MNKKGFTLIELLAVIVILAVIALIATPAVLNIIEDSRRSAAEASARNIVSAAKTYYATKLIGNSSINQIDITDGTLKYSGEQATKGKIFFDNEGNTYLKLYINGYCVERNYNGVVSSGKVEESGCEVPEVAPESDIEKKIGDVVYYNPTLNDYCTDYVASNSALNQMDGCLKWHIYKIDEDGYNLILDHAFTFLESDIDLNVLNSVGDYVKIKTANDYGWAIEATAPKFIDMVSLTGVYEEIKDSENIFYAYIDYVNEVLKDYNTDDDHFAYSSYGAIYFNKVDENKENALSVIEVLKRNHPEIMLPEFLYKDLINNCDENLQCMGGSLFIDFGKDDPIPLSINFLGPIQTIYITEYESDGSYKMAPVIKVTK